MRFAIPCGGRKTPHFVQRAVEQSGFPLQLVGEEFLVCTQEFAGPKEMLGALRKIRGKLPNSIQFQDLDCLVYALDLPEPMTLAEFIIYLYHEVERANQPTAHDAFLDQDRPLSGGH